MTYLTIGVREVCAGEEKQGACEETLGLELCIALRQNEWVYFKELGFDLRRVCYFLVSETALGA